MTKKILTQERLKHLFHYNPETGVFTRNTSVAGYREGLEAGGISNDGYVKISVDGIRYRSHQLAWLYVNGKFPDHQIDHINGVRCDNRIVNLRDVPQSCNAKNQKLSKANKSGVTGVCWDKVNNKWLSQIVVNRVRIFIGRFSSMEDAIIARKEYEKRFGFHDNHGRA